jgi:hypothetical protein
MADGYLWGRPCSSFCSAPYFSDSQAPLCSAAHSLAIKLSLKGKRKAAWYSHFGSRPRARGNHRDRKHSRVATAVALGGPGAVLCAGLPACSESQPNGEAVLAVRYGRWLQTAHARGTDDARPKALRRNGLPLFSVYLRRLQPLV